MTVIHWIQKRGEDESRPNSKSHVHHLNRIEVASYKYLFICLK